MMRPKSLMSPVEAAGYAMAPSEEDMAAEAVCETYLVCGTYEQPEEALRNGHAAAARVAQRQLVAYPRLVSFADPGRFHWLRDLFSGWWFGGAAA
jgi:hypothetical protein